MPFLSQLYILAFSSSVKCPHRLHRLRSFKLVSAGHQRVNLAVEFGAVLDGTPRSPEAFLLRRSGWVHPIHNRKILASLHFLLFAEGHIIAGNQTELVIGSVGDVCGIGLLLLNPLLAAQDDSIVRPRYSNNGVIH